MVGRRAVALVTYAGMPDGSEDDRLLRTALRQEGIEPVPVVWDDPAADWGSVPTCVVRSTWDYHLRHAEFVAWVERAGRVADIWNPPGTLIWNSHKEYLAELERRGVPIVPTAWLRPLHAGHVDLAALMADHRWQRAVVKPVVSASSFETILVGPDNLEEGQAHIDRLLPTRGLMVQPFLTSTHGYGERSHLFIDGRYSHSVRRPPMLGNDPATTGSPENEPVEATAAEIEFASGALEAARTATLYARVDVVKDDAGTLRLMELELVEPEMFFRCYPPAATTMARAIATHLPPP